MSDFDLKDPKGRPASAPNFSPYDAYRHDAAAMVGELGVARIGAAHDGIRAIITILQQREVDMESDGDNVLALPSATVVGLLNAIACCADFAEMHATGCKPIDTHRFACNTTDHHAAMRAAVAAAKRPVKAE
ncbi:MULTISPECIES: hypothetical protein [Giesbergeria]|uniref:Uncharacterized protein n=1 Tax=Giesbergeria sinuosa TaxID=80883 RepID=A0ABV9QDA3_9BURK